VQRAVRRALAAAGAYLDNKELTLRLAVQLFASNAEYVRAAVVILQSEDAALRDAVLTGRMSLLAGAKSVKRKVDLVAAYRAADSSDKLGFAHIISPEVIWSEVIEPACGPKTSNPPVPSRTVGDPVEALYASQS
jgi:Arc/MetJ-type ribon-helix-helix transcriptional regulator